MHLHGREQGTYALRFDSYKSGSSVTKDRSGILGDYLTPLDQYPFLGTVKSCFIKYPFCLCAVKCTAWLCNVACADNAFKIDLTDHFATLYKMPWCVYVRAVVGAHGEA